MIEVPPNPEIFRQICRTDPFCGLSPVENPWYGSMPPTTHEAPGLVGRRPSKAPPAHTGLQRMPGRDDDVGGIQGAGEFVQRAC